MGHLSITDLTLERAGSVVLRNFSAELEPGAALMIEGPNGSGKTTLLRAIAGLLPVAGGTMLWGGEPLAQDWREGGGRIAFLGHQDGVKSGLTVKENLAFWRDLMGAGDVERALDAMHLIALKDRIARSLSAGQRRRLALSRLLLGFWDLWLLDEPTTALDISARALLSSVIENHLRLGGAAMIAGHDLLDIPGVTITLPGRGA